MGCLDQTEAVVMWRNPTCLRADVQTMSDVLYAPSYSAGNRLHGRRLDFGFQPYIHHQTFAQRLARLYYIPYTARKWRQHVGTLTAIDTRGETLNYNQVVCNRACNYVNAYIWSIFACMHDWYWTHACDVDKMKKIPRETNWRGFLCLLHLWFSATPVS